MFVQFERFFTRRTGDDSLDSEDRGSDIYTYLDKTVKKLFQSRPPGPETSPSPPVLAYKK